MDKVCICGMNTQKLPKVSSKECNELLKRMKNGDREAKDKLVLANMRLVLSIVKRFQKNTVADADDLFQCGVIGLIIGAGYYLVAALALAGLYLTISVMPTLEEYLKNRCNHFEVQAELNSATNLPDFVATVRELGIRIDEIELNPAYVNSGISVYSVALTIVSGELKKYKTHKEIIEALKSLEYIRYIEEMN